MRCTNSSGATISILSLVLVAIITSGIPLVEVHSHDNASFGHSHSVDDFLDDHEHSGETASNDANSDPAGDMHAHAIGTAVLSLVPIIDMHPVVIWNKHDPPAAPQTRPPDIVIRPQHRPPIA